MEGTWNETKLTANVEDFLNAVGENPEREGLLRTPQRHVKALRDLTSGYQIDIEKMINGALFEAPSSEMVIVQNIEFYSLCEHHLLPFFGKCHVAYIPKGKIIGLSKIPRLVDTFARRLQVQEMLTHQVADCLMRILDPLGVGVVTEAHHMCMMMRGVQKQGAFAKASSLLGDFRSPETRNEFFNLIR